MNKIKTFLHKTIFPIKKEEIALFLPLAVLLFSVLFNFSALKILKDSLIIPLIGPEAISFLKLWFVFPCAIGFTVSYVYLSNYIELNYLFCGIVCFFVSFVFFFAHFIIPNQDFFHMSNEKINLLSASYPHYKWFINLVGRWSFIVIYVIAELWSGVVINLMFWQFINHIIKQDQASRIYPIMVMIGNTALVVVGGLVINFTTQCVNAIYSIQFISNIIFASGIFSCVLFLYVYSLIHVEDEVKEHSNLVGTMKTSLSLKESIKMVSQSRYVLCIAMIVICYGLTINILEGPWKAKVVKIYSSTNEYIKFMGYFNLWVGIASVIFTIIGGNAIRILGWTTAAYITPLMIIISGSIFFSFIIFDSVFSSFIDPIFCAVIIGSVQNVLSKSAKYSIFDATKEMAYIPLNKELRTKGKAAVEVMGTKFGKSMGALLQFLLFTLIPNVSFDDISYILIIVFIIIGIVWINSLYKLSKEYNQKIKDEKII